MEATKEKNGTRLENAWTYGCVIIHRSIARQIRSNAISTPGKGVGVPSLKLRKHLLPI